MSLITFIWTLTPLVQLYVVWQVLVELRSPYAYPRWYWMWGFMGAAALLMLVWLLHNLLWVHHLEPEWFPERDVLIPYVWLTIAVLLALTLREAQKIYSPLAPLAPLPPAIVLMDSTSTVLVWNRQATLLFGWTEAEAMGAFLPRLIIPERLHAAHLAGVAQWLATPPVQRRLDAQYLTMACHKQGHEFRVEVVITGLTQPDGTVQFHGAVRKLIPV